MFIAPQLRFPAHFSKDLRDLLKNLIQPDVTQRFGGLKGMARDVKVHPSCLVFIQFTRLVLDRPQDHVWFSALDFHALYRRECAAPFVPKIKVSEMVCFLGLC